MTRGQGVIASGISPRKLCENKTRIEITFADDPEGLEGLGLGIVHQMSLFPRVPRTIADFDHVH